MLLEFSLILTFTLIIGFAATRFKIPLTAAYVLSGVLLGSVLRLFIPKTEVLTPIAQIGIVLLMFTLGIEFSVQQILAIKRRVWQFTSLQLVTCTFTLLIILLVFKLTFPLAIIIAVLFSFSSTVMVAKILTSKGQLHTQSGELSMSILLLQDMIVLPISIILPIFFENKVFVPSLFFNLFLAFGKSILIFVLIAIFAKKIIPKVLQLASRTVQQELLLLAIVSVCFFFSGLSEKIGFSLAIGAFMAGLIISQTGEKHQVFAEVKPMRDLFSIIFFVYLGFSLEMNFLLTHILEIVGLTAIVLLMKIAINYLLLILFKYHKKTAILTSANLSSISEFAFILSMIYLYKGWITSDIHLLILSTTLLTMIASSFMIAFAARRTAKMSFLSSEEKRNLILTDGLQLARHVILCGAGRIGKQIMKQMLLNKVPFVVIEDNRFEVDAMRRSGIEALYGNAAELEILNYAGVKTARAVIIAIPDRFCQEIIITHVQRLNPNVVIFGRAHKEADKKYLYALGLRYVVFPEFEGAMAFSKRVLKLFGVNESLIEESLKKSYYDEKIV